MGLAVICIGELAINCMGKAVSFNLLTNTAQSFVLSVIRTIIEIAVVAFGWFVGHLWYVNKINEQTRLQKNH